jgi:hypothetical protein
MSLDRERGRACVSPDRGESETCVEVADPGADLRGIEVGGCAVLDPTARRLQGADDADCAAGDLGG